VAERTQEIGDELRILHLEPIDADDILNDKNHSLGHSVDTPVKFLCTFLAVTGAIAIISALSRLGNPPHTSASDSALETSLFKWSAPAGLTYGIVAILLVIVTIKFWSFADQRAEIERLRQELEIAERERAALQSPQSGSGVKQTPIRVVLTATKSESVLGGGVLLTYEESSSQLHFQGIEGIGRTPSGPFNGSSTAARRGDQFFIKLRNGSIWGVNVVADGVMTIELFHVSTKASESRKEGEEASRLSKAEQN